MYKNIKHWKTEYRTREMLNKKYQTEIIAVASYKKHNV